RNAVLGFSGGGLRGVLGVEVDEHGPGGEGGQTRKDRPPSPHQTPPGSHPLQRFTLRHNVVPLCPLSSVQSVVSSDQGRGKASIRRATFTCAFRRASSARGSSLPTIRRTTAGVDLACFATSVRESPSARSCRIICSGVVLRNAISCENRLATK